MSQAVAFLHMASRFSLCLPCHARRCVQYRFAGDLTCCSVVSAWFLVLAGIRVHQCSRDDAAFDTGIVLRAFTACFSSLVGLVLSSSELSPFDVRVSALCCTAHGSDADFSLGGSAQLGFVGQVRLRGTIYGSVPNRSAALLVCTDII